MACANMNHRRTDAPVRFCPMCGEIVNTAVASQRCAEEEHGKKRRSQSKYCADCGEQLIQPT